MKVIIDYRWVFDRFSGIGMVTASLVSALAGLDNENEYYLLAGREQSLPDLPSVRVPYGIYSLRNQLALPRLLREMKADVFHSTNFVIPLLVPKDIKIVVTIHDLIPWLYPEFTPQAKKTRFRRLFRIIMRQVVRRADRIISVSENTASDIVSCLQVPREKISVVYNGLTEDYFDVPSAAAGENKDYILFVGRADPYKNLVGLIRAYDSLLKRYGISHRLLVVGEEDQRYPEAKNLVSRLGLTDRVVFCGYVSPRQLRALYARAAVFVLPSFYEGFGLPPLEAMACGVPVAVSELPVFREVLGDKAVFFNPHDYHSIAAAIYKLISEPGLAAGLAAKGMLQANKFTVEKMARETIQVYQALAGGGR